MYGPYSRRRYSRRNAYARRSRPTDRIIQAGTANVTANVTGYLFTATDPCTATNFQLDCGISGNYAAPVAYVLVYIPDGYNANNLTYPTVPPANMYEPSQYVIISGVLTDTAIEDAKVSRYSRKLKPGDRIALQFYTSGAATAVGWELNFTNVH